MCGTVLKCFSVRKVENHWSSMARVLFVKRKREAREGVRECYTMAIISIAYCYCVMFMLT